MCRGARELGSRLLVPLARYTLIYASSKGPVSQRALSSSETSLRHFSDTMASTDYKFSGWLGLDAQSADGNLVEGEYKVKPFEDTDVDIKITHCGQQPTLPSPVSVISTHVSPS